MEKNRKQGSMFLWVTMAVLVSQNLVIVPVMARANLNDQKNYYFYPPADPTIGTPPSPIVETPPTPTGGSQPSPPSHGGGGHHGGGGSPSHGGGSPPSNCGKPPSSGGGSHHNKPSPSTPGGSGGGYYNPPTSPSTPSYNPTPSTPSTPTPIVDTPPSSPLVPTPPSGGLEPSTPPFSFDPNSPPFTCDYWKNHPGLIWGLVGWWGTVCGVFGLPSAPTGFGPQMNLLQALSNTRNDGLGELYREGTASLLNSLATKNFPFTAKQVRDSFAAALASNSAAASQARLFKLANHGHKIK